VNERETNVLEPKRLATKKKTLDLDDGGDRVVDRRHSVRARA
jgi:hypothetical protein